MIALLFSACTSSARLFQKPPISLFDLAVTSAFDTQQQHTKSIKWLLCLSNSVVGGNASLRYEELGHIGDQPSHTRSRMRGCCCAGAWPWVDVLLKEVLHF